MHENNVYIKKYPGDIGVPDLMSRNDRDLLGI